MRRAKGVVRGALRDPENEFDDRAVLPAPAGLGEFRRLSARQKAWGMVQGWPEVSVLCNIPTSAYAVPVCSSAAQVLHYTRYISRSGRVPAYDEEGCVYRTGEALEKTILAWRSGDAKLRPEERALDQVILGISGEVPRERFEPAVLDWAREHIRERPWVVCFHYDHEGRPHAHLLCRHRSWRGGRVLRVGPGGLRLLREDFASRLIERGIEANATRPCTRGRRRQFLLRRAYAANKSGGFYMSPSGRREVLRQVGEALEGRPEPDPVADMMRRNRVKVLGYAAGFIRELRESGSPGDLELAGRLAEYYRALPPVRSIVEATVERLARQREQEALREETPAEKKRERALSGPQR
ncbi:hypothetical protein MUN46_008780 [Mesosutterella sp. AGMB02718]|uniref:Relaxase n=1 Tax=Mesosutterella faecium TaxID=2925194 RepID=A0ABT7INR6_9BURK|nr:hypothetical protein [Mesosutterella sp. AGMB02718]MDL2060025.1 hypothetical protein [Mesosutterella sp. AGMB02718]